MTIQTPTRQAPETSTVVEALLGVHGSEHEQRIREGVDRVAQRWQEEDGSLEDFEDFCRSWFISDAAELVRLLDRFETVSYTHLTLPTICSV